MPQAIRTMTPTDEAAWELAQSVVVPRVLFNHGTYYGYHGYGCRCTDCAKASREHQRDYRRRRHNRGGAA